jgi:CHAT domain-containing protein/tetratricopeptide (TPR) repeat protein
MWFTVRFLSGFLALFLISVNTVFTQTRPAAAQDSADEAALRSLAEAFVHVWTSKDLDGFLRLWAPEAPGLESQKQEAQKFFAAHERIEIKNATVRKIALGGEKARLRVDVEFYAVEAKTGKPAPGLRKRLISCAKSNGRWRVWSDDSAYVDLAKTLTATATEEERDALLKDEKDLWSAELTTAIHDEGIRNGAQGLYPAALTTFRIAQSVAERIDEPQGLASALNNIGLVHIYMDNYHSALEPLQKSLRLAEATGNQRTMGRARNNLGLLYERQGDYSLALESYRKYFEMAETQGNKADMAMAFGNIGNLYAIQGRYSLAAESLQKSRGYYREAGVKAGEGRILHSLGLIAHDQGNYELSLKFHQESLAIKEETGNRVEQARTLTSLGRLHLERGEYKKAEDLIRKGLAICEASDVKNEASIALSYLGEIDLMKGDYDAALERFLRSFKISEAIGNKQGLGNAHNELARIYLLRNEPLQCLEAAKRASEIAKGIGSLEMLSTSLTLRGRAERLLSQPASARKTLEEAVAAIEATRVQAAGGERETQGYFENKASAYRELVGLLIDQNKIVEALSYAERAKGRALLDVLQYGKVDIQKAMTVEERETEHSLKSELTGLNTKLTKAAQSNKPDAERINEIKSRREESRRNYEAFQTSLHAAHPELKANRGEASIINAEELVTLLPDAASALLEYVVTDESTYLFVVTKSQGRATAETKVFTIPVKQTDLARQIDVFRRQLAERNLSFRGSAQKLYGLLLKPAEALLRGKSDLVIAPDDRLWELPFQALLGERGRYLLEMSAVSYAPSLTVLREMRARRDKRRAGATPPTLLALGNPLIDQKTLERPLLLMRDEKLYPLPEAEAEVRALGRLYGARRSKVYIGPEANEDRLKTEAGQARILHFATHGVLNDAAPLYSYLALAAGNANEDGLLEAWELMKLDLKADLAVLSACETARGRASAGEGVIGLTWALFIAGAPSTVVSQWSIESASARELMIDFHRRLLTSSRAGDLTKAENLRRAALNLMKSPQTFHPFYWAGYVLVGDGR